MCSVLVMARLLPLLLSWSTMSPVTPLAEVTEVYSWPGGKVEVAWPNTTWASQYGGLHVSVIGIKVT